MNTREILVGARKLLTDPAKWIKGDYERNGCYCLMGALHASGCENDYHTFDGGPVGALQAAVRQKVGYGYSVILFNDADDTTHADVLGVLDLAITIAKAGAQS